MKFLFREESVTESQWKKRRWVVERYFEQQRAPFVRKTDSGYSKADFELMIDYLHLAGVEV